MNAPSEPRGEAHLPAAAEQRTQSLAAPPAIPQNTVNRDLSRIDQIEREPESSSIADRILVDESCTSRLRLADDVGAELGAAAGDAVARERPKQLVWLLEQCDNNRYAPQAIDECQRVNTDL